MQNMVEPTLSGDGDMAEVRSMVQDSFTMETCMMVNKMRDLESGKKPHN